MEIKMALYIQYLPILPVHDITVEMLIFVYYNGIDYYNFVSAKFVTHEDSITTSEYLLKLIFI